MAVTRNRPLGEVLQVGEVSLAHVTLEPFDALVACIADQAPHAPSRVIVINHERNRLPSTLHSLALTAEITELVLLFQHAEVVLNGDAVSPKQILVPTRQLNRHGAERTDNVRGIFSAETVLAPVLRWSVRHMLHGTPTYHVAQHMYMRNATQHSATDSRNIGAQQQGPLRTTRPTLRESIPGVRNMLRSSYCNTVCNASLRVLRSGTPSPLHSPSPEPPSRYPLRRFPLPPFPQRGETMLVIAPSALVQL